MAKRQIDATQVLNDMRSGMDDTSLMEKYDLSANLLSTLFQKLQATGLIQQAELESRMRTGTGIVAVRPESAPAAVTEATEPADGSLAEMRPLTVSAEECVRCIRAGMSDLGLMAKFRLSATGLQSLFRKLLAAGLVTQTDLDNRVSPPDQAPDVRVELESDDAEPRPASGENKAQESRKCPSCGMPMSDLVQECLRCGFSESRFKAIQSKKQRALEARWVCPSCGKPQAKEFSVCPACGVFVSRLEDKISLEKESKKKFKAEKRRKDVQEASKIALKKERPRRFVFLLVVFGVVALLVLFALYAYWKQHEERTFKLESALSTPFIKLGQLSGQGLVGQAPCLSFHCRLAGRLSHHSRESDTVLMKIPSVHLYQRGQGGC